MKNFLFYVSSDSNVPQSEKREENTAKKKHTMKNVNRTFQRSSWCDRFRQNIGSRASTTLIEWEKLEEKSLNENYSNSSDFKNLEVL